MEAEMGNERKTRLVTDAIAGMNARDLDAYGAMFAEDVLIYTPGQTEPARGRAARVGWVADLLVAFPDAVVGITSSVFADDRGSVEFTFTGTHSGPLKGAGGVVVPPTGARVSFPYCVVYWYDDDDLATEIHEYFDQVELLVPLGLLKPASS
jgi:ketosteroid isomerase-like protein